MESYYRQLEKIFGDVAGGIGVFAVADRMLVPSYVNEGMFTLFGIHSVSELKDFYSYIYEEDRDMVKNIINNCITLGQASCVETRYYKNSGEIGWLQLRCAIDDFVDGVANVIIIIWDISEKKEQEIKSYNELKILAERDSLTNLYNHNSFIKYVQEDLDVSDEELDNRQNRICALFMIDVDDFKIINDVFGHYKGDVLLERLSEQIKLISAGGSISGNNIAGRLGGDEFAVYFSNVNDEKEVEQLAGNMCKLLSKKYLEIGHSVSIGVVIGQKDVINFMELYKKADQALYYAKRNGKNRYVIYNDNMEENYQEATEILYDETTSYLEEEGIMLDSIADNVYIVEPDTYKLLYVNEATKAKVSDRNGYESVSDEELSKHKCYEWIYNRDTPCEFCPNEKVMEDNNFVWQSCQNILNKTFIVKDKKIKWHGKAALLKVAFDISNPDNIRRSFEARFQFEDTLSQCILCVSQINDYKQSYAAVLKLICEFYSANKSCIIELSEEGRIADITEWKVEDEYGDEAADGLSSKAIEQIIEYVNQHSSKDGISLLDNIEKIHKEAPEIYDILVDKRIWSLYSAKLVKNGEIRGYMFIFNISKHKGEMMLLNMLSLYMANEIIRKQMWLKNEYEITHDVMTGVLNRKEYLNVYHRYEDNKTLGVVTIDANGLKAINDDFGYTYGNKIIIKIANILKETFLMCDIYRFDSDDFVVMCPDISKEAFSILVNDARQRFDAMSYGGASLGSTWNDIDINVRKMREHAEEVMAIAKKKYYDDAEIHNKKKKDEVSANLIDLLKTGNFKVYIQPKYNISDSSIYGAEALIRLDMDDFGLVSPDYFIPLLEKSGTIRHVDLYVLEEVCKMIRRLIDQNIKLVPISFNFSRVTLLEHNLFETVDNIIKKYNVPRSMLELEITETVGDLEYETLAEMANGFHNMGMRVSMDDFGARYSSISTLALVNFDILKIDKSVVNNLCDNDSSAKIVKHVIDMCYDLDIECIAEGVETKEQAEKLSELRCNVAQGYYYARPEPIQVFEDKYIASNK